MNWNEGDVVLDGVRIHYYRRGTGRPLVLAHGFSDNGKCWERLATVLEDRYDIIAYDARYHGLSEAPEGGGWSMGADLVGLVKALDLDWPAIMGHSMGAMTVAEAAGLEPALFRCAVLEDPPWRDGLPGSPPNPPRWETPRTVDEVIAKGRQQSPTWHDDEFPAWAESKLQLRIPADWANRRTTNMGQWREAAAAIGVPALLIRGGNPERGRIVDDSVATTVQQINPRVETACFAQAGHNIRREAFAPYVAAVSAFLARHR